ncbi:recombinase family protein [Azospirillum sp. B4]|uniref:recombinase family protein n=1 Tax=Azospirillum sp. B4 TaxID=95605 RepID=UPI0005CB14FD|nr:recombinase family protein [Azospirillum sp. B4]
MLIGYARTSTLDQTAGLEAQQRDLSDAGCERMFVEQVSSVDRDARTQLAMALDWARDGDILVVTKLDRLARSVAHLMEIVDTLTQKGAALRVLSMGIDTSTATGKLMLTILGGVAEFERSIMLERQREGIAKAKQDGKYKGRKPTAMAKADEVRHLKAQGMGGSDIAKALGISRASVYRALEEV